MKIILPLLHVFVVLCSLSRAEVSVVGVKDTTSDIAYAADVSATDLVNAGSSTLSAGPTFSEPPFLGPNASNDGAIGPANGQPSAANGITFWNGTSEGEKYSITYSLDTSINTLGYDINSIQSITGWNSNNGAGEDQKNQNYIVEVSTVGSATFNTIATVTYFGYVSTDNGRGSTKIYITEDATGLLATGVDEIRFTYTIPVSGQGPTIREIDVFGVATGSGFLDLEITSPVIRQVVQRDSSGLGSIPVAGNLSGTADLIEARAVAPDNYNKDLGAIWFIGDSITQSNADNDSNGSPRKSLYDLLVADGATFSFTGHRTNNIDGLPSSGSTAETNLYHYHSGISGSVIGDTGERTNMTAGIPEWWDSGRLASTRPNIVLIMLGTNDINLNEDVGNAPNRMKLLVNTILAQVGPSDPVPAIFVAQITPNTGSTAERQRVVDFNDALPAIISTLQNEGKDVNLVDQFSLINANTASLMKDSLHTNSAGNDVLASQWFEAIKTRFAVPTNITTTPWQTIATNPTENFNGVLSNIPAGGWYSLEVRAVNNGTPVDIAVIEKVGVGDVYVTCGQSNSANSGFPAAEPEDDRVSAWNYETGAWTKARDPMPGASGNGGSVWTRLGDLLTSRDNVPVAFACLGRGGTEVNQWVPGAQYYGRINNAVNFFPAEGFRAVLWHQGESDSDKSTTATNYQSRIESVIEQSRVDAGWDVPWFICEVSFVHKGNLTQETPVAAGQRRAIFNDPLVFPGPVTDDFHLENKLNDEVHFNAAGLADHAEQWAEVLGGTPELNPKNGDFEANAVIDDGAAFIMNTSSNTSPSVIGWRILSADEELVADGSCGSFNPDASTYPGTVDSGSNGGILPGMSGKHVAFLSDSSPGSHFLQTRRVLAEPGVAYSLTVALGVRDDPSSFGNSRLEILANGVVVASSFFDKALLDAIRGNDSSGTFTDANVIWTPSATLPSNQPLAIRIMKDGGAGTVLDFDNVRFTALSNLDFETWAEGFGLNPADQGFLSDPDGDGLANGLESWFGSNPEQANPGGMMISSDGITALLIHPKTAIPLTNISGSYQWSTNLTDWYNSGEEDHRGVNVLFTPTTNGGFTNVTVTPSIPNLRLFLRVVATPN